MCLIKPFVNNRKSISMSHRHVVVKVKWGQNWSSGNRTEQSFPHILRPLNRGSTHVSNEERASRCHVRALWAGISFEVALGCLVCSPRLLHCSCKQLVTQTHEVPQTQVNVLTPVRVVVYVRVHAVVCLCAPILRSPPQIAVVITLATNASSALPGIQSLKNKSCRIGFLSRNTRAKR